MTETTRKKKTTKKTTASKSLVQVPAGSLQKKLFIALGVTLVVILATVIYALISLNNTADTVSESGETTNQRFYDMEARLAGLQDDLDSLGNMNESLMASQQALEDAVEALQKERPDTDLDWTLREVEYLVRIAMHRLHLERDIASAVTALQTADQRLLDLANPGLIPLRDQLAADINTLQAVEQPDVAGMAAQLTQLGSRIDSLPLKNPLDDEELLPESGDETEAETTGEKEGWRAIPSRIWEELSSLVVIKRSDGDGSAFIMPNEEYYLQQNLKLELANARIALLRRDNATFQAALEKVAGWLNRYYDTHSSAVQNVITAINRMQASDIRPELPDPGRSLEVIRDFIDNA